MMTAASSDGEPPSLRDFQAPLAFGFFNATSWIIGLGTPMILLAGQLGATAFEIGLAYSFVFILLPVQVLATVTLPRFGYKRQMIFGWASRIVFLFFPLFIAFLSPAQPAPWMMWGLIVSVFGFSFMRSLGSCAVMPWIYGLIPESIRGRYFATEQFLTGVSVILTLLLCAATFHLFALYTSFQILYAYAIVGSLLAVGALMRMPDVARPATTTVGAIVRRAPVVCVEPGGFRRYLFFMVAANVMTTAFSPFIVHYLNVNRGLDSGSILLFAAMQYVGGISGSWFLRSRIDRIGITRTFRLSHFGNVLMLLFWLGVVGGLDGLMNWLPVGFFLFGLSMSFLTAAHLQYLPKVCPENERALTISVHSAVVGLMGGIAPILWGLVLRHSGDLPGMHPERFALFIGLAIATQLGLAFFVGRLEPGDARAAPLRAGAAITRPFRYIAQMVTAVDTPTGKAPSRRSSDDRLG
jgi:MFS family permease